MNRDEIIDLLSCAAAYDRRTIGQADVAAWLLALGDLPFDDARAAVVAHYSESTEWLMPAHVRQRVRQMRHERLERYPVPSPRPEAADDTTAYRAELGAAIRNIADGRTVTKALTRGQGSEPPPEYNQARGRDRDPVRIAAMQVPCPWPPCRAHAGAACVDAAGRRLKAPAHDGRLVKAGLAEWVTVNGVPRAVMKNLEHAS